MAVLKRIDITELRTGMVVVRCDRAGVPFNEYGLPLSDSQAKRTFASYGVKSVYIWEDYPSEKRSEPNKEKDYDLSPDDDIPAITLAAAAEAVEKSRQTFSKALNDIKKGNVIDGDAVNAVVSDLVRITCDTPGVFMGIARTDESEVPKEERESLHGTNLMLLSVSIAQVLGMKARECVDLSVAALFHDVGKSRIPEKILSKKEALTAQEFSVMKHHPEWGVQILSKNGQINDEVLAAVLQHHECCDGSGYPSGLAGFYLTKGAKILAVAEAYDEMVRGSVECYKAATRTEAIKRIYAGVGKQFSEEAVKALVTVEGIYPVGTAVRLTNGEIGVVCEINRKDLSRPKIIMVDKNGKEEKTFFNLAKTPRLKVQNSVNHEEYGINPVEIFEDFLAFRVKAQIRGE